MRVLSVISIVVILAPNADLIAMGADRPNLIFLIADDLGYGELGCQGNPQIPTPHIDSIADRGVRFTDGYVTAAYCSASRAGLVTGRYQNRFGYEFNPIGADNEAPGVGLPSSEITLARHLRDAGYATALIGKWHLGGSAPFHPIRRGFDEFFGFLHEGHYFVPPPYREVTTMLRRKALPDGGEGRWVSDDGTLVLSTHMGSHEPSYDANNPILRGGQPVPEDNYLTDAFTREAIDFIDRNHERPFFLCLAYNAVHSPLQGADAYMRKFSHIEDIHRRIFAAMLANLDDSVGEVVSAVEQHQLSEQTLIVFLSDNGGPTKELTSSNLPLRGGKGQVYEGGIRIPFLMQWPSRLPKGVVYEQPVISLDLFATALAVTGTGTDQLARSLDGVNLIPFLTGAERNTPPHNELYWRLGNRTALRAGDWKLLRQPARRTGAADWELYNLAQDISETNNLADAESDRVRRLEQRWNHWNDQMIEPFWSRNR